jgi:hypothetical protein
MKESGAAGAITKGRDPRRCQQLASPTHLSGIYGAAPRSYVINASLMRAGEAAYIIEYMLNVVEHVSRTEGAPLCERARS